MPKEMTLKDYKAKYGNTNKELGQMMGVTESAVAQFLNSAWTTYVIKDGKRLLHDHRSGFRHGTYKALSAKRKKAAAKKKKAVA